MTIPPGPPSPPAAPPSKGMAMIASYRAARLSQRPVLRAGLRRSTQVLRRERESRAAAAEPAAEAACPPPPLPQAAAGGASVFAGLVSLAVAERDHQALAAEPDVAIPPAAALPEPVPDDPAPADPVPADPGADHLASPAAGPPEPAAPDSRPEPPPEPPSDPPLAEIGFGPGMLIRLSQLGLRTIADLAQADAGELRLALGDISRLVDVETWINNARQTAGR